MAELFRLGQDGVYRCEAFQQFSWQAHAFGTRLANPAADVTLRQIHSDIVWNAGGLKDRQHAGDALVTGDDGLAVGVRTADCVPILLLDGKRRVTAAIHAGWRGSAAAIVNNAVQKMAAYFDSQSENIWAAIGPCIRECCYEVGSDVSDRFTEWTKPAEKANGRRNLNLAEVNVRQLILAGVPAGQIFDSGLCTYCQIEMFYSFRRQPLDPGRMLSAIGRL